MDFERIINRYPSTLYELVSKTDCLLYDPNEDKEITLKNISKDGFEISNSAALLPLSWLKIKERSLVFVNLSESTIQELNHLLESIKPEGQKHSERLDMLLSETIPKGSLVNIDMSDKEFLYKTIKDLGSHLNNFNRSKFFDIVKNLSDKHWSIPIFEKWVHENEDTIRADGLARLHLTYMFRHTGRSQQAIEVSNVVEFPRSKFNGTNGLFSVICTVRAAVFMDIFNNHNDKELLLYTRKTLNKAWANEKSAETSSAYQRLDKLNAEYNREVMKIKLNEAYSDWKNWTTVN